MNAYQTSALVPDSAQQHASARWETDQLDLPAYLQRIGYSGSLDPTLTTLTALARAHLNAIPFENLDILTGSGIQIDLASVQNKMLSNQRGGYCHEHNTLFATVLDGLGFEVRGRSARILLGADSAEIYAIGHTMLNVLLDGQEWLVDVGMGNFSPRGPIPIRDGAVVQHDAWAYRLDRSARGFWVLSQMLQGNWVTVYQFSGESYYRADYASHNFVVSNNPQSVFTNQIIVRTNHAEQVHTLINRELKILRADAPPRSRMIDADELPEVLRGIFGIDLPASRMRILQALLPSLD